MAILKIKKLNLMDGEEYKKIIANIYHNYRINVADMLAYAERRGIRDKIANFSQVKIPQPKCRGVFTMLNKYKGCLLGLAVGDALGAAVEFMS